MKQVIVTGDVSIHIPVLPIHLIVRSVQMIKQQISQRNFEKTLGHTSQNLLTVLC